MTRMSKRPVEQVGEITAVENHGTIVTVVVQTDDGKPLLVHFDHRPFSWLLEGEGLHAASALIGRRIAYDGNSVRFLRSA